MAKPERFIAVADNHGDMIDPETEAAIHAFIREFKPTVRAHLGDAFDFRCLRRGASEDELAESLTDDWDQGSEFLRKFFEGGTKNLYLNGNHDQRIFKLADSSKGLAREYAKEGVARFEQLLKRCRVQSHLPYDSRLGVLRLGNLKMVHGYSVGVGAASRMARAYGNVIFGHNHTVEVAAVDSDEGPKEARCIGCVCKTDMPYNAHQLNKLRHSNGFAYGFLLPGGDYQLFQARKINGRFYAASEILTF